MTTASNPRPDHMISPFLKSFERHLKAERRAQATIDHYLGATAQFVQFCQDEHLPSIFSVTRGDVEFWLERLNETYASASVKNRYLGLRMFFKWLVEEGEMERSPMALIKAPILEEMPKDVVSETDMAKVLAHLEGLKRWRDCALIAILYDTGMRTSELARAKVEDLDMDTGILCIPVTKGKRVRYVRLSPKALRYLDRYHRSFRKKPRPAPEFLVTGQRREFGREGIYWAVRRCFEEAGVKGMIGGHDLRHTSASHVASAGIIGETDALELFGWRDTEMWRRYTDQVRRQAALKAHERGSPLERLDNP